MRHLPHDSYRLVWFAIPAIQHPSPRAAGSPAADVRSGCICCFSDYPGSRLRFCGRYCSSYRHHILVSGGFIASDCLHQTLSALAPLSVLGTVPSPLVRRAKVSTSGCVVRRTIPAVPSLNHLHCLCVCIGSIDWRMHRVNPAAAAG